MAQEPQHSSLVLSTSLSPSIMLCGWHSMCILTILVSEISALKPEAEAVLESKLQELNLPETLADAIRAVGAMSGNVDLPTSCPAVETDHSLDAKRLLGYWDVLGTKHPAFEELFDCPMTNITDGGVVKRPGHATEHYNAYFQGFHVQFDGDEYIPDPAEPGKKLFSVTCAFGHCGLYIPYFWIETDADYRYASVYYCWPKLPLLRGYLVMSRKAVIPPPELERRFLANASRMGLVAEDTKVRYRANHSCWEHFDSKLVV